MGIGKRIIVKWKNVHYIEMLAAVSSSLSTIYILYCRGKLVHQSQRVGKAKSTQAKHTNISTYDKPSATSRTPYRLRDENVLIMEKTNLPGLSYPA